MTKETIETILNADHIPKGSLKNGQINFSDLSDDQKKIVFSNSKINVALSVPGSGKTTVLVNRALRLSEEFRDTILIVTFSKKACDEIQKRLPVKTGISVKTIHAFCYGIVKDNWDYLKGLVGNDSWGPELKITTKDKELELITEVFQTNTPDKIFNEFNRLRLWPVSYQQANKLVQNGLTPNGVKPRLIEDWSYYENERLNKGMMIFNDLSGLVSVLQSDPTLSSTLTNTYSHIMIDEAQDTSEDQWKVLRSYIYSAESSLIVGDYNQSIYGWRNADGSILLNAAGIKDSIIYRLSNSYRSTSAIADIANQVVFDKSSLIINTNSFIGNTNVKAFGTEESEAEFVLNTIGDKYKNTAVLARTNAYLETIERKAIYAGIPYYGNSFYKCEHIMNLYRFLRDYKTQDVSELIEKTFIRSSAYSKSEQEDFRVASQIIKIHSLDYFFDLVEKAEMSEGKGLCITTGHKSKGLEWESVHVIGCNEGMIPHKNSLNLREEQNLLYVMITRAKKNLSISYVKTPSRFLPKELLPKE